MKVTLLYIKKKKRKEKCFICVTRFFAMEVAFICFCLYFWAVVYKKSYVSTWIFMITFLLWKALKWNCLLVVFKKLAEISKTMITLRWPKCFGKLVAFLSMVCCPWCIYRGNHTSRFFCYWFTLRNLLFVTTHIFICQYLWPSYEAISCHSEYMLMWNNIHRKTKISTQLLMLNIN